MSLIPSSYPEAKNRACFINPKPKGESAFQLANKYAAVRIKSGKIQGERRTQNDDNKLSKYNITDL